MKKLLILLLVLGLASTASALVNISDDFESPTTLGALNGQGAWSGSGSFVVVAETSNQYVENAYAGTKTIDRTLSFSDDVYSVELDFRLGSDQSAWGTGTPCQLQIREASGADPVHIKWEPASQTIRVGSVWLTNYSNLTDTANDALKDPYSGWVHIRVDIDEVGGTAKLYWEENDGDMNFQGNGAVEQGTAGVDAANIKYSTRSGGSGKEFDIDNLLITPEPATIMLLGLGGLALIRRKR